MEFEPEPTVTNEARLLAQTKRMTLQPADPFLKPEDTPNPIVVDEIQPNIEPETENTGDASRLVQPSHGNLTQPNDKPPLSMSFKITMFITSIIVGVGAGAAYFMFIG